MDSMSGNNYVELGGIIAEAPEFSHFSREKSFYSFPLEIARLSGAVDRVNVTVPEALLSSATALAGKNVLLSGELRSYNNKSGTGSRLLISAFARELKAGSETKNQVLLRGSVCKTPNYRRTPMGREICDVMLAVNRHYGRSDYLPCILWGQSAQNAAFWPVGRRVALSGRLQSRKYIKLERGESVEKTAFEVSVFDYIEL